MLQFWRGGRSSFSKLAFGWTKNSAAGCLPDQKCHWASFIDAGVGTADVPTRTRTEFVDCETDQTDNGPDRWKRGMEKKPTREFVLNGEQR